MENSVENHEYGMLQESWLNSVELVIIGNVVRAIRRIARKKPSVGFAVSKINHSIYRFRIGLRPPICRRRRLQQMYVDVCVGCRVVRCCHVVCKKQIHENAAKKKTELTQIAEAGDRTRD